MALESSSVFIISIFRPNAGPFSDESLFDSRLFPYMNIYTHMKRNYRHHVLLLHNSILNMGVL